MKNINNFIDMSRFTLSGNNFYSSLGYERPATSAKTQRMRIASTGESFLPSNTISNFRPQTGRSTSSSFRNTKGRLQGLSDQLATLLEDIKQTRLNSKDLHLHLDIVREELNHRGIDPLKLSLTQEIKLLDKSIQIKRRSDMLKFEALHETCHALTRNSKQIKGKLNEISDHLQKVENLLGYHGVRDKLRY